MEERKEHNKFEIVIGKEEVEGDARACMLSVWHHSLQILSLQDRQATAVQ